MGLWSKIAGTVLSSFGIGNGAAGNKTLYAETGAVAPPALRWNDTYSVWELSFDGVTWEEIVTKPRHKELRQLQHFIGTNSPGDGFGLGPYVSEATYAAGLPTSEIWFTSAAKTHMICQWQATYNVNRTMATETWIVYQEDGLTPVATAVDVISYSGLTETGRVRTFT